LLSKLSKVTIQVTAALIMLLTPAVTVEPETLAGPVRVIDGDTLDVAGERVRLWGIDAVEGNQILPTERPHLALRR
jgi:endonuclease YncB( thermonuclease family)